MRKNEGLTLVEIMVVCTVIGLLAAVAVPSVMHTLQKRQNQTIASQLRLAAQAFELCKLTSGAYPPDSTPGVVPDNMQTYFDKLDFSGADLNWTACNNILGGKWDWDLGQFGYEAGVSVYRPTVSVEQMQEVDRIIDDGNLATGRFRSRSSGYILIMEM